jgi:hypothetical protein
VWVLYVKAVVSSGPGSSDLYWSVADDDDDSRHGVRCTSPLCSLSGFSFPFEFDQPKCSPLASSHQYGHPCPSPRTGHQISTHHVNPPRQNGNAVDIFGRSFIYYSLFVNNNNNNNNTMPNRYTVNENDWIQLDWSGSHRPPVVEQSIQS